MSDSKSEPKRKASVIESLITFGSLMFVMAIGIIKYEVDPHMPMFIGVIIATLMALKIGYKWSEIEKAMMDGVYKALQSVIILCVIGILIGVWILAGVVPSMIYYGLNILSPGIFLPATVIICSITSLATGSSWGTAGTVGVALMGVAIGLGIPAPLTAGAIISGSYFGDKMSPLSDTTNLAPAMAGTNVFSHIKYMVLSTSITYVLTLAFFIFFGMKYHGSGGADLTAILSLQDLLQEQFTISPILLLPPLVVIVSIAFKMPAIPGITIGIIVAAIMAPIFQGALGSFGNILSAGMSGYVSETGVEAIDTLLSKGGLESMMFSVSMNILAMMFGGIAEATGQLEALIMGIVGKIKSDAGLVISTLSTCIISNVTMPEQYISIVIPGRMFAPEYRRRNIHPVALSNCLEGSGTVSAPLIPWNTCGVYMSTVLGIKTMSYAPYAFFNYTMPIVVVILAILGFQSRKMTPEEAKILADNGSVD